MRREQFYRKQSPTNRARFLLAHARKTREVYGDLRSQGGRDLILHEFPIMFAILYENIFFLVQ